MEGRVAVCLSRVDIPAPSERVTSLRRCACIARELVCFLPPTGPRSYANYLAIAARIIEIFAESVRIVVPIPRRRRSARRECRRAPYLCQGAPSRSPPRRGTPAARPHPADVREAALDRPTHGTSKNTKCNKGESLQEISCEACQLEIFSLEFSSAFPKCQRWKNN